MKKRLTELLRGFRNPICEGLDFYLSDENCEKIAEYLIAEGVIVPPCKAGDKAYHLTSIDTLDELNVVDIFEGKVSSVSLEDKLWICCRYDNGLNYWYTEREIGRSLFFDKEEAEEALKGANNEQREAD